MNTLKNTWLLVYFLFLLTGLHIPRSITVVTIAFLAVICVSSESIAFVARKHSLVLILAAIFGLLYTTVSAYFSLWPSDSRGYLESASFFLLPTIGLFSGLILSSSTVNLRRLKWILFVYLSGSALYFLASLVVTFWHQPALNPFFFGGAPFLDTLLLNDPWDFDHMVNIRSMEQNIVIACAVFPPLLLTTKSLHRSYSSLALASIGIIAILVGLLVQSRLVGLTCFFSAAISLILIQLSSSQIKKRFSSKFLSFPGLLLLSVLALAVSFSLGRGPVLKRLLSRIYDERFDRALALFQHLPDTFLGGKVAVFSFWDIQRQASFIFDARVGDLMHNVFLDVVIRTGIFPALILITLVFLLVLNIPRYLISVFSIASAPDLFSLSVAFLSALVFQWLFQPLIYSDQVLFFFSFFILGAFQPCISRSDVE